MKFSIRNLLILPTFLLALSVANASSLDSVRAAFVRASVVNYAPDAESIERFITYSDNGRANDVLLLQLYMSVHLPDWEVERLLALTDPNGAWPDIDYTDQTRGRWQPTLHLTRLYSIAKLYADPQSHWFGDRRLQQALHTGIAYWLHTTPRCPNWWHNDIGVPKKMTSILLMLRDELSAEEVEGGLRLLERSAFGRTGQNRVWLAGNNLMKGLLTDDCALVKKARDIIAEEICVTENEGIQADWSFHQHGPQIQFGNYGLTYVEVVSFWIRALEGSPYAFSDEQYAIIERLITEGISRSVWRSVMDPSFCGRQVFINGGRGKACSLAVAAQNMAATGRPGSAVFNDIAAQCLLPERAADGVCGASYFWRSDCGAVQTADWYASIRMHSERTIGFEMTNDENQLANFSADGALLLMQDGYEYDNIFAHWDWRHIPGTTAYDDGRPILCRNDSAENRNHSRLVGGAVQRGLLCADMELRRDSLHALKSVFFFDDVIVAAGCSIGTADPTCRAVFTTIDQTHLRSDVVIGTVPKGQTCVSQTDSIACRYAQGEVAWVHHDNRGYVLLEPSEAELSTRMQQGVWDRIDPFYKNKMQQGRVFRFSVEHNPARQNNRYAYALLPHADAAQTARFAAQQGVSVLRNDAGCQAVAYKGAIMAVFRQTGRVSLGRLSLKVDAAPVVVILQGDALSVSSPLPQVERVQVTVRRKQGTSRQQFDLPTDPNYLGSTITQSLR